MKGNRKSQSKKLRNNNHRIKNNIILSFDFI
jgi:hypothetical protein